MPPVTGLCTVVAQPPSFFGAVSLCLAGLCIAVCTSTLPADALADLARRGDQAWARGDAINAASLWRDALNQTHDAQHGDALAPEQA